MRPRRTRHTPLRTRAVIMDGGLNENVTSIELKGGELTSGLNYELLEGSSGGYRSIAGYERFDGRTKPSSIAATDEDHTAQDAARAAIGEVPGEGNVLAVHMFEGKVYAFRNKTGGATAGMYVESATGWTEVDTSANPLSPSGKYHFVNYNFTANPDDLAMYWVDGQGKARAYNGTSVTLIDNTGMDPNDKPINIDAHNNRLFLAYLGGSLQYSNLGDPNDWATGAGEIGIGREITALQSGVGNALVIFCDQAIRILEGQTPSDWILRSFSDNSGAFEFTVNRMLGTMLFMDYRGITTLTAVQDFGNFESNSISQKVKNTLLNNKDKITCATISRPLNQYRIYFSDKTSLVFSFLNKRLRGVTLVKFDKPVLTVTENQDTDNNSVIFFTSDDGYVYQMDSGTSFDGAEILTILKTAYFHYGSPRNNKRFSRATLEVDSPQDITIRSRPNFDYRDPNVPKSVEKLLTVLATGDTYGDGIWGTSVYSAVGDTNRLYYDIMGIGVNMSLELSTNETYKRQHTIQNFITDYTLLGRRM